MAKVTFEYDEDEDLNAIKVIVNRHKLCSALADVDNLRRDLVKGYNDNWICVKDGKVLKEGDDYSESSEYTKTDWIINELEKCLDGLYDLIY